VVTSGQLSELFNLAQRGAAGRSNRAVEFRVADQRLTGAAPRPRFIDWAT
jgi:hypothetical protein